MGLWTLYFAAKIYLYYRGFVKLDVVLNLLFFAFLLIPIPQRFKTVRLFAAAKLFLSTIFAILLLWHDTWFPAPLDAYHLLKQNGMPSREYIYSFLLRFYDLKEIVILAVILTFCILVRKYRRTMTAGTALLLLLPLVISSGEAKYQSGQEIEKYLGSFYNSESLRLTHFIPPKKGSSDFDIIILHVCSLSWDDLREMGMENHPFLKQFDFLFTNFNSVAAYSNPSAIRLLNANCGQRRHADIYGNMPKDCSLMDGLRDEGDEIYFARNHNGKYGNFDDEVMRYGHLDIAPYSLAGLVAKKYMFDDSPVYDDYSVLDKWWTARLKSKAKRAALYYNTVSLHDGSHWINDKDWWKKDHREVYREFLTGLFDDMTKFFNLLESSKRDVIVVFIGEHGRAVRGSGIETPGLRDIPLPRITTVPVGIKFIGRGCRNDQIGKNIIISKPTSYFALSYMLAAYTEQCPFITDRYTARKFIDSIPQTEFVSENEGNVIVKMNGDYFFYGKDGKWIRLTEHDLN